MRLRFFFLVASCLLAGFRASAQSPATLKGSLTDPSGAAVAGAKVSARRLDVTTNETFQTKSQADGRFELSLQPGRYRASIVHPSFAQVEEEFALAPGETREWNARLRLEPLASTVVVTAEREPIPAETASAPVDILTREEIDGRQVIWLAPLLATLPGITATQSGPAGGITSVFLNGGNSNFTKVLVDGTPVNEPGGRVEFSNYTLENVGKIEVVHGASSALFGSDAMTGVVQIFTDRGTTRRPKLILLSEGGKYGTWNGSAALSGLLGGFDYSAAVAGFETDGQGPNDRFRDNALSGNFGYRFSDTDRLRLTLRSSTSDAGAPGQTLFVPPDLMQHDGLRNFSANLGWDLDTGAHWHHHLAGTESYLRQLFADPPNFIVRNQFNRAGLNEQSSYLLHNGTVTAGYQYEVENGFFNGPHARRNNQAGYIEARYQLGRRLTANAGGRAEANASFGTRVVPRVGASYAVRLGRGFWGPTRLRASYGLGIKEPEFLQSFSQDLCFPGNPDLRPERSRTVNAGVDQALASDRLRIGVDFFHNHFHDLISFAPGPPTASCPFGTGTFFNTDSARVYGVNATLEAHALRWLRVVGNYTYDNSRVLKAPNCTPANFCDPTLAPGNRLFLRPLHSANLMFNAGFRRTDLNLVGTFVGRRTDSDFLFPPLGLTSAPSYLRVDLAASFALGHGVTALGRVENLFDRTYQEALGFPALRLTYRAGMKYTWGGE